MKSRKNVWFLLLVSLNLCLAPCPFFVRRSLVCLPPCCLSPVSAKRVVAIFSLSTDHTIRKASGVFLLSRLTFAFINCHDLMSYLQSNGRIQRHFNQHQYFLQGSVYFYVTTLQNENIFLKANGSF